MNKIFTPLLLGIISVFIISCNNTVPTSTPDDELIANNVYQNNYFSFSLPLPENWVVADSGVEEKLSQAAKDVVKNNPALEAKVDEAAKRNYQLLFVSQYPLGAAVKSNPFISITAENVAQFPSIKTGADYLAQGTKLLMENLSYDPSYKIYEYNVDGKPFYRTDLVLNASAGPVRQSYISTVSGEYVLSIILSGQTNEEIMDLEEIIQTGNFANMSTEVVKSEQRPVSSIQGIVGMVLIIIGGLGAATTAWYKRRKAKVEEDDSEDNVAEA
jgi:hypothetical protein